MSSTYCATCRKSAGPNHRSTRAHLAAVGRANHPAAKPDHERRLSVRESERRQDLYLAEQDFLEHGPRLFVGDEWGDCVTHLEPPEPPEPSDFAEYRTIAVRPPRGGVCVRCGQAFRTTAGHDWHDANRPDCDKVGVA